MSRASVENNTLKLGFDWLARAEGFPPLPTRWVRDTPKNYEASLEIYAVSDIGLDRTCLNSSIIGETTVLFPRGGSTLDQSKIEEE